MSLKIFEDKYGLFNVDEWKNVFAEIIAKKIDDFNLENTDEAAFKKEISAFLTKAVDNFEKRYNEKNSGGGLSGLLRKSISSFAGIFDQVKEIVKGKKVFIILDSNHTHKHVLSELNFYSKLMKKGQYLICGDTIIANQPQSKKRPRRWNKKNNPMTALKSFLKINKGFVIDKTIEKKMLITNMPSGFLKKI